MQLGRDELREDSDYYLNEEETKTLIEVLNREPRRIKFFSNNGDTKNEANISDDCSGDC